MNPTIVYWIDYMTVGGCKTLWLKPTRMRILLQPYRIYNNDSSEDFWQWEIPKKVSDTI